MTLSSGALLLGRNRWTISLLGWKSRSGRFGYQSLPALLWRLASRWARGSQTNGKRHQIHLERFSHNRGSRLQMHHPRWFRSGVQSTIDRRSRSQGESKDLLPDARSITFARAGYLERAFLSSFINLSVSSNFRITCWSPFIAASVVQG